MELPTNAQKFRYAVEYGSYLLEEVKVKKPDEKWTPKKLATQIAWLRGEKGYVFTKKVSVDYLFDLFVNNKGLVP